MRTKLSKISSKVPEFGIICALGALMIITQIANSHFLSFENMTALLKSIPFVALVSLGSSLCLTVASLDIACGRIAGLCGMVFGYTHILMGLPLPVALLCGVATGLLFGIFHAIMVVGAGINAFIVTMGTMYVAGGFRYLINSGDPINLPAHYRNFSQATPLGISWLFWIVVAIYVIIGIIEAKTVFGRRLYAVGSNGEVAKLQGVNVKFYRAIALILSGLFSGMAGVMATIDINSSQAATGTGWEFKAVAGCFVGGVSLSGGSGRAFGVAIGVFFVFVMDNIINMLKLSNYWAEVFTGGILILSVLYDVFRKSRKIRA